MAGRPQRILFKVVHAYAFEHADRQDLFQEVAVQVWRSVDAFRGQSSVPTWLYRVALNAAISWTGKEGRHQRGKEPFEGMEDLLTTESAEWRDPRVEWMLESGDWRGVFEHARVLKRDELDGQPVFLIHAAPERGRQRLIYLDTENGLTRGYDEVQDIPRLGAVGCEVRFANYREIEGGQIPFKRTVKYANPKLGTRIYQVEKIETRLQFAEDPFAIK